MARYRTAAVKAIAAMVVSGLSSCAVPPAADMNDGLCAFEVTDSNAWINRMPTVGQRSGPTLNVMVRVQPADSIRALAVIDDTGPVLGLKVVEGRAPLQPGTLSWRMYAPATPYEAVEISCNGNTIARIDEIDTVY